MVIYTKIRTYDLLNNVKKLKIKLNCQAITIFSWKQYTNSVYGYDHMGIR